MKQQFTGPYTFNVAARTITLAGIEVPQERLALIVNATVGFIYHNLEHEPTAQVTISGGNTVIVFPSYKDCETHRNTDALSIFYDDGVDLGQLIKDESDETQALLQAEFDETQTAIVDFRTEVKSESDETQTLLQTEFDEAQTAIVDFRTEVKSESDETQALLQAEFDETQTAVSNFKTDLKSESDETQALLRAEFDETQAALANFRTEVKAESDETQGLLTGVQTTFSGFKAEAKSESDETQALLNQKLAGLINEFLGVEHIVKYSAENGVKIDFTSGGYGPSQIVFSQGGATLKTLNLTYDARGNLVLITENPLLWTFASGLSGTITGFCAVFTGAVNLLLGNTSTVLTSNATTNQNVSSGTPTLSLSSSSITSIVCGTSSPKLGGTIDVSGFPNLTSITCAGNGITRFKGYGALAKLVNIDMRDNNFVQSSFETFANKPDLQTVNFTASTNNQHIGMTGPFPIFLENPKLTELSINNTALTGSNLNFSHLTNLTILNIVGNALSGAFPILPTGANSKLVSIHVGQNKSGIRFTGSPPLFSDHPNLTQLFYPINHATGPIQTIPSRAINFQCHSNLHTGNIPSMAGTSLGVFLCHSNQLTGFDGGAVPASLGNFQAQNNQLPAAAVNAILAAFVAAGRSTGTRVLDLGGTGNAAPTGQGIIDKATLEGRGWTVTTN